ncbi:hypothetical protein [Aneurinibacillus terranovensis]|uniref:hypothetical protein n=1 Tax=Aneurinibacillus terranovensis TaxID=278991 RepID=UPI000405095E|nr:hypothetical protein [Aneurinibacillus terranovensis]
MVKQFLRRVFFTGKTDTERENVPVSAEEYDQEAAKNDWMEQTGGQEAPGTLGSEPRAEVEEKEDIPLPFVITRDKIEKHNFKEAQQLIAKVFHEIENGERRKGRIRLSVDPELAGEMDEFLGKRLGKYIELLERETYDITAFLDWGNEETSTLYATYVLPSQTEKQDAFIKSRILLIYDTCDAIGWEYRKVAREFAAALGFHLPDDYFIDFEAWLGRMDEIMEEQSTEAVIEPVEGSANEPAGADDGEGSHEKEEPFARMIPFQISRDEVEQEDISQFTRFFDGLDKQNAARKKEKMVFSFYGFAGEVEDLVNNPAVNTWASLLVEKYPYIFYFLNDEYVPMTSFLTSLVVRSRLENDQVLFDPDELQELTHYIGDALRQVALWTGEDGDKLINLFERKLKQ